jgi:hypothetical protein
MEAADIPIQPTEELNNQERTYWMSTPPGKLLASAVMVAEVTPLNEAARWGTFAYMLHHTGDPVIASSAAAAVTLGIEGGAAAVTSEALATQKSNDTLGRLNQTIEKRKLDWLLRTNPVIETAISITMGSAVVTAIKHRQDLKRTKQQNLRYGMTSAAGISAMTATQGVLIGEGIAHPSTQTVAGGILAVGMAVGGFKWARARLQAEREHESAPHEPRSIDAPQLLGPNEADAAELLTKEGVRSIVVSHEDGSTTEEPLLVPTTHLYWYNQDYLQQKYGTDNIYYYAHPHINLATNDLAKELITQTVEDGGVVVFDTVTDLEGNVHGDISEAFGVDSALVPEKLGGGREDRFLNQYVGPITFTGQENVPFGQVLTLNEQYEAAIEAGIIERNTRDGASFEPVITGEDADRLWNIYDHPFEALAEGHPINAGFDKQGFMDALADPEVLKVINKVDGEITTLAMFVSDFKHCPWLDKTYYQRHYAEAYNTNNLLIFTGIVSDETRKGGAYSLDLIDLLMKVGALRKSPVVITFECGDISAEYVPKLVDFGISHSGEGFVQGLDKQVSQLNYYAFSKHN